MVQSWYDIIIVGGGIVGLATARDLLIRRPGQRVAILEKESAIGQHQTGHNSGVIHAGVYYAPGSLKARLCAEGREKTYEYCEQKGIRYEKCGKLIVAVEEEELPRLQNLWDRATANGVPGIRMVGPEEIREIEPHSAGIKGIFSPETGIVNWSEVARHYAEDVTNAGGEILTNYEVAGIRRKDDWVLVKTTFDEIIPTKYLITCAGLQSDRVAAMSGADKSPQIVPFRGDYLKLKPGKEYLTRGMIYPVPDPRFPFLGVHFTKRHDGEVWLGPNAVYAFARQGYGKLDFNIRDNIETLMFPGFWKMVSKHWKMGADEMVRDFSKKLFVETCKKYVPEVTEDDCIDGPSGVRAQALGADGSLVDDFIIQTSDRIFHVRNAPSPAATSSMAIGRAIADRAEQVFSMAS
ncbi:MAG TPA: L-2-hydroxyglutarate oxidase [Chloroflexota bacterium]|nr:L-2-hydroxyglutarate oxidase [Chloroflexota bacterium]